MTASSTLVEPAWLTHPDYHGTHGPEVAELCELAGYAPDPEQSMLLDLVFAFDSRGEPVADEVVVIAPRQNLKTGLFKQAAIGKVFYLERPLFVWSAHEFSTTQEAFRDLQILIESCPTLDRQIKHIHQGSGAEAIELLGGQRIKFKARTKSGGRGLTGDDVLLDEGFALQPAHMGALQPTMAARPESQMLIGSSAGKAESDVLRGFRDRGRPGAARLIYAEWCVRRICADSECGHAVDTPGCVFDDVEALRDGNPALDRRITRRKLMSFRQSMPPEEFVREFGGQWDAPAGGGYVAIPLDVWNSRRTDVPDGAPDAFGLDMTWDREWASIAWALDGYVDLHAHRRGAVWVVDEFTKLHAAYPNVPVWTDPRGPAAPLIEPLRQAGLRVEEISTDDYRRACGAFHDAADDGTLTHSGHPALDSAVSGAVVSGGSGAWVWDRKKGAVISPLIAATYARWAATTTPRAAGRGRVIALD